MASPISQYGYIINGNEVSFTSLSLNTNPGTNYLWDFGDGNTSIEVNPIHIYPDNIFYVVTLKVTNSLTEEDISSNLINLTGAPNPILFNDLGKIIDLYTPTVIAGTIRNYNQKEFLIAKWQTYIQPLLVEPEVLSINTYNVNSYPPLANSLIAKLVVIDIIEMESATFLLEAAASGGGNTSSSSNSISSTSGGIKSIETGPTKVERYENKDASSNSEKLSNLSKTYLNLTSKGGILDQLKASACQDSKRIQVYLPMCGPLSGTNKGFQVTSKNVNSGYNANPFGITDRMT